MNTCNNCKHYRKVSDGYGYVEICALKSDPPETNLVSGLPIYYENTIVECSEERTDSIKILWFIHRSSKCGSAGKNFEAV